MSGMNLVPLFPADAWCLGAGSFLAPVGLTGSYTYFQHEEKVAEGGMLFPDDNRPCGSMCVASHERCETEWRTC
jgi:hypothetical protein